MTDIASASNFYLRFINDNQYSKIEAELKKFEPSTSEDLEKPIKKGTICAARFSDDGNWYRAKVLSSLGKGDIEVQFIDFGNLDVANCNAGDLKRLPEKLLQYEPQAKPATLAFLKVPKVSSDLGAEAAKVVQDIAMDAITDVIVVDQYNDGTLQVILMPAKGEKDWNKSVNFKLLASGLAQISNDGLELPSDIAASWYDVQENAREEQIGVWVYGGAGDDSD
jgi:staphylococcal nuclease domain-containing protein 1